MQKEETEALLFAGLIGVMGAVIGLGKLLQSGEKITVRLALGRAIGTSALGMSAFAFLAWIPDVPNIALVGIAALLASMGESAVERCFYSIFHRKN